MGQELESIVVEANNAEQKAAEDLKKLTTEILWASLQIEKRKINGGISDSIELLASSIARLFSDNPGIQKIHQDAMKNNEKKESLIEYLTNSMYPSQIKIKNYDSKKLFSIIQSNYEHGIWNALNFIQHH